MFERLLLAQVAELAMGETIIAEDCDGRGLPIYSAATGDTAWNYSTRIKRRLPKGTIVVGARGSIGFPRMPGDEWFGATQTTITVAAKESDVLPKYLFHFLRGLDFKTLTSQQAIPMLTVADFGALSLPLPPASEQAKIAEVLDTLDTTLRQTEALIDKLKLVKQGLLHDLLTRGIDANGELRPPRSEAPGLYKDSVLGWTPREWEVSNVGAEFEVASGITLGPHRAPKIRPRKYLRVANVQRAHIDLSDVAELDASDAEMATRSLVPGDLLIVEGHASPDEIGRCAMTGESERGYTFQNHLFRLRPMRLMPSFALQWMNSNVVRSYWRTEAATSSGLNTINRTKLNRVVVVAPDSDEQHRIVYALDAMDRRLDGEASLLNKLRAQKSGLMTDLLTGRVRVTPLLQEGTRP